MKILFSPSHENVKRISSDRTVLKVDFLMGHQICCLQAYVGICQPGNFTGWGSEGVKKLIRTIFMFTHFILFYFGPALGQNWWWPSYSIALFLPCYKTIAFGQNSLVVVLRWFAFRSKPNDISTYFTRLYVVGSSFALFEVTDSGGRNSDLLLKYIYRLSAPSACLAS